MHQNELQAAGELSTNLIGETPMRKRKMYVKTPLTLLTQMLK